MRYLVMVDIEHDATNFVVISHDDDTGRVQYETTVPIGRHSEYETASLGAKYLADWLNRTLRIDEEGEQ